MNRTKAYAPRGRRLAGLALILLCVAASGARAQTNSARLQISHLDQLAARAAETVDINIDERLLRLASRFLSHRDANNAQIREIVAGLQGVYVRSFEFDREGEYSPADIEPIRAQLRSPGWTRPVGVRSRRNSENVEVHLLMEGDRVGGLAIISAEPKKLTIVNIVGPIDIERLSQLEGSFGIPHLEIEIRSGGERQRGRP